MNLKPNYIQLLGIIVISFGTYLTYLGTKKDSDKTEIKITDKINSFNKKLESIQTSNLSAVDRQKKSIR